MLLRAQSLREGLNYGNTKCSSKLILYRFFCNTRGFNAERVKSRSLRAAFALLPKCHSALNPHTCSLHEQTPGFSPISGDLLGNNLKGLSSNLQAAALLLAVECNAQARGKPLGHDKEMAEDMTVETV